jgi:hypothetical protein
MRRHIPGLHQAAATQEQEIPDGFFLVRVDKATYRAYKDKPFLTLILAVEDRIDGTPGVAVMIRDNFKYRSSAKTAQRFGCRIGFPLLSGIQS